MSLCLATAAHASTPEPELPAVTESADATALQSALEDVDREIEMDADTPEPILVPGVPFLPAAAPLVDCSEAHGNSADESDVTGDPDAPEEKSAWTITPMAMGWIPSIKGSVEIGNVKVRPDLTVHQFWSAWKQTQTRTIEFHANAKHESGWAVFFEIIDLKLEADETAVTVVGPFDLFPAIPGNIPGRKISTDVDAVLRWTMLDFGVGYDVTSEAMAEKGIELAVIGGGRYWEVDIDLELNGRNLTGDDADWLDGFVGIHTEIELSKDGAWEFLLRSDVGGFGIGESSKIATRHTGVLRYRPSERFHVSFGWTHLDNDWSQGSGSSKAAWNLRLSGPVIALGYDF